MTDAREDIEHPELVTASDGEEPRPETESVQSPAKVMRIGTMVKQLLDEVKAAPLDDRSRERLTDIYQKSVEELADALSPDLQAELQSFALPFADGAPSDAELRVAQAQLVGWLEGLFHGIQATLFAQQLAAQQQLQQIRGGQGQLPPGAMPGRRPDSPDNRPGTYL
jgi:Bacterial proteasome activator